MGDKIIDPLEVNKDPQLIKDAQSEIGKLDVLVCGECHSVFHYIEQFQEHKLLGKCPRESPILESCVHEQKPQVWAFMLWKNAKFKNASKTEGAPSSWSVYQLWCNLENSQKEAWVTAGRNIQSFTKLSTAKVQEVKSKVQPLQLKSAAINTNKIQHGQIKSDISKEEEEAEDDPLEEGEIRFSQLTDSQKKALKSQSDPVVSKPEMDPLADSDSEIDTEDEVEREAALAKMRQEKKDKQKNIMKKSLMKPVQLNSDVTILPSMKKNGSCKKALRTIENDKQEEYVVEKIISRRYNPGKKMFEYLLKWENCDEDQNTWEPASHLNSCRQLLDQFEINLKKQKAQKNPQKSTGDKKSDALRTGNLEKQNSSTPIALGGRPQRTSKQKALNQVKAWCGSISDADEPASKRSLSDTDSDSIDKKIKLEPESSDSDEEPSAKKLKSSFNGASKKQPLPDNVLVPDSQGIVRINQKQLPALSSGVYVMSKTAGIIKLDSNTSKIATSGGHAVIKVAPKIGQTSIKVIKKDFTNNNSPKSSGTPGKMKLSTKIYSPKIVKKPAAILRKQDDIVPVLSKIDDESDDGIEELEFPTDLPLPSPESPPGEFTLCPLTGKIVGQDYPEEEVKEISIDNKQCNDNSYTNIVKIAAADILSDKDIPIMAGEDMDKSIHVKEEVQSTHNSQALEIQSSSQIIDQANHGTTTSILSTALNNADIGTITSSEIIKKKQMSATILNIREKSEMARNIINRTIVPKPAPQAIITRISSGVNQRNKPFLQKPMLSSGLGFSSNQTKRPLKQTHVNKNVSRKVVNSAIFDSSVGAASETSIKHGSNKLPISQPANVINMPLLTEPEISQEDNSQNEGHEINTISINESETPLLITGEDGTIYQVAGQNEDGQTILITQGVDGQQQCLLVASENAAELTHNVSSATSVEAPPTEEPFVISTEQEGEVEAESDNVEDSQVVAQIVSAQPPSPGGTRKVVLMLPDGNLMMTEVTAEQYAALELDK